MKKMILNKVDEFLFFDKLSNGLSVYMLPNFKTNNFYITLTCKYGSLHDEFSVDGIEYKVPKGIAHFLEHVNFNEENGKTAHDFFNKIGSSYNAFTTFDYTCYEVCSSNFFEDNLSHLIEYVSTPIFTKKMVEKEKGIICEEVKMGKNNNGHKMFFGSYNSLLINDKRKFLITGDIDDVKKTTVEDLSLIYNTFYVPENMFLIITGNFNVDEARVIIDKTYSKIDSLKFKNPIIKKDVEPLEVVYDNKVVEANVEIPKVKMSYKMNRSSFDNFSNEVLDLYISAILHNNFGSPSDFREELLNNNLVSYISANCDVTHDLIILSVVFETNFMDQVVDMVENNLRNMTITNDDIKRKSRVEIASYINSFDDIEYVNSDIMDQLINTGKINDNYYDMFNNLNIKDAMEILKNLDFSNRSIFSLVPFKE